jgi:hypothetical protein
VGFCQHFSSAYAMFMRAAGVPTRVVTGYVGGHYNKYGSYWLLKQKDAHAWDEIWLDGRGWVRVDPTAAIAPENILDTLDDLQARQRAGLAGPADAVLGPMLDGGDFLRRQWNSLVLGFNALRQQSLLKPIGIDQAEAWQLVAAFGAGSALALCLTLWILLRQHRDRSHPLLRAWRQLTRRLAWCQATRPGCFRSASVTRTGATLEPRSRMSNKPSSRSCCVGSESIPGADHEHVRVIQIRPSRAGRLAGQQRPARRLRDRAQAAARPVLAVAPR